MYETAQPPERHGAFNRYITGLRFYQLGSHKGLGYRSSKTLTEHYVLFRILLRVGLKMSEAMIVNLDLKMTAQMDLTLNHLQLYQMI